MIVTGGIFNSFAELKDQIVLRFKLDLQVTSPMAPRTNQITHVVGSGVAETLALMASKSTLSLTCPPVPG
jgi:hypothetical protein